MNENMEVNKKGYLIWKDSGKLVHRWVAGKKYGKEAIIGKEIHHIDGDKKNNDKSNLLLLNKEDHHSLTLKENKDKFLIKIILFLSFFSLSILVLIMCFPILDKESGLLLARVSILIVFFVALELRFGLLKQMIRRPKEKYFDWN